MSLFDRTPIVIVGAQKAGTSSLFQALSGHSAIAPCRIKEPQFFALSGEIVKENLASYRAQFPDYGDFVLEASTFYLSSPEAPELVGEMMPDAEIVCVLRDPVERAYSGYWHMRKKVPSRETRTFRSVVEDLSTGGEEDVVKRERKSVESAAARGEIDPDYLVDDYNVRRGASVLPDADFQDPLWCYKYFSVSRYSSHLERWKQHNSNVHLMIMEELVSEPVVSLTNLLEQVGLCPEGDLGLGHHNPTRVPRGGRTRRALQLAQGDATVNRVIRYLTRVMHPIFYRDRPALPPGVAATAAELMVVEYSHWGRAGDDIYDWWPRADVAESNG